MGQLGRVAMSDAKDGEAIRAELDRWCVYEDRTGVVWHVDPDTQETAEQEARLAGEGHRAVPLRWGEQMRNAFAHGRMAGLQAQAARDAEKWDEGYRAGEGITEQYVGTFYDLDAENPYARDDDQAAV